MDRIPYKLNEVLYPDHNKVLHSNEYSNAPYQVYNLDPNSQNNGFYLCNLKKTTKFKLNFYKFQ